jgi:hypothetical protein
MSGMRAEAGQPGSVQDFEQSDRNPTVSWRGTDSDGGQVPAPGAGASRVTRGGEPSTGAGLVDYTDDDSADAAQDEEERES